MSDTPTITSDVLALAGAIERRAGRVAQLLRGLNACQTLEEVRTIYSESLLENGFVRADAAKLVCYCRVAKVTGYVAADALPVPAIASEAVEGILARDAAERLQPELRLGEHAGDHEHERMLESLHRAGDHSLDEEGES